MATEARRDTPSEQKHTTTNAQESKGGCKPPREHIDSMILHYREHAEHPRPKGRLDEYNHNGHDKIERNPEDPHHDAFQRAFTAALLAEPRETGRKLSTTHHVHRQMPLTAMSAQKGL
eukprot:1508720-Amphidinium_carterae.1